LEVVPVSILAKLSREIIETWEKDLNEEARYLLKRVLEFLQEQLQEGEEKSFCKFLTDGEEIQEITLTKKGVVAWKDSTKGRIIKTETIDEFLQNSWLSVENIKKILKYLQESK
jgi:hypothetical protein